MSKLIKKICKKCVNECARQKEEVKQQNYYAWGERDECLWKEYKSINCRAEKWTAISIYEIPESCIYKLEQTVLNEKPE